jgi:hypothetical protein
MAPLCSSGEGSTHRKCPGVDTRSVRRASGLLETGLSVTCRSMLSGLLGNERTVPVFPESETFKSVRVTAPSLPRILKGLTSML